QDRRTFLKTSVAAAGGLTVGSFLRHVSAQPKVTTIRTGYTLAPEHPVGQVLKRWGDNLNKKTNGAYVVQVHGGGVLGSGRTAPEGVAIGTLESYWVDPAEYASFNQALNILSAPYMWSDRKILQKAVQDPEIVEALYAPVIKKGIRALSIGYSGTRMLTTKNTPAKRPEDLKGLRIRVPEVPVFRDMVASWGATPTPIPMADIFTSLQAGMVDGQENPYPQILSNRFYEVQKYLVHTAHIVQTGSIIFSEQLFQKQPKEFQKILVETAQDAVDWYLQFLTSDEGKMLEQLKGYGMTVVEPDVKAFREATTKIYEKYDSIWTKALREKIQNYKA
ncbi:MAG TPA: TRAP transporter substrate-binding protein, partial [Candidatus Acidoferrum sp.]|nr:TRAP transporter substrate-binding protein [Candidatus Acidoferrum sp.]